MLDKIQQLHERDMVDFDPEDVIFITNKWDSIISIDENEVDCFWRQLKSNLRNIWPDVEDKNIFRVILKHVITHSYL